MRRGLLALLLCGAALAAHAEPSISIIIDDLGYRYDYDRQALNLPVAVTYAVLPDTPYGARLAREAHAMGHEVMLHLPMQAESGKALGPGGLTLDMTETDFRKTVRDDLAAVPYAIGINNHMGSLLTRAPGDMDWLMSEITAHGHLFFIDSFTAKQSVAEMIAVEHGVPTARRDVFLDADPAPGAIRREFARTLALARRNGTALAIGHPYPNTLNVLAQLLSHMPAGVALLPVSQLIPLRHEKRVQLWQASSFPSPQVAKNSKP